MAAHTNQSAASTDASKVFDPSEYTSITGLVEHIQDLTIQKLKAQNFYQVQQLLGQLQNQPHDIFDRKEFLGFDDQAFANMKPAFQLATRFLEDERLNEWFIRLREGKVKREELAETEAAEDGDGVVRTRERTGSISYLVQPEQTPNPAQQTQAWKDDLELLSKVTTWRSYPPDMHSDFPVAMAVPFEDLREARLRDCKAFNSWKDYAESELSNSTFRTFMVSSGVADMTPDGRYELLPGNIRNTQATVILNPFFNTYFKTLSMSTENDTEEESAQRVCALFMLAVTIVHELCHCI
jgi:hypothetical protein